MKITISVTRKRPAKQHGAFSVTANQANKMTSTAINSSSLFASSCNASLRQLARKSSRRRLYPDGKIELGQARDRLIPKSTPRTQLPPSGLLPNRGATTRSGPRRTKWTPPRETSMRSPHSNNLTQTMNERFSAGCGKKPQALPARSYLPPMRLPLPARYIFERKPHTCSRRSCR